MSDLSQAMHDVFAERQRQMTVEDSDSTKPRA